jgi:hypothetical protein
MARSSIPLALLALATLSSALEFDEFVSKFGKQYENDAERAAAQRAFAANSRLIREHNSMNVSWKLGVNQFADTKMPTSSWKAESAAGNSTSADSIDWFAKGVVCPVVNEGSMGYSPVANESIASLCKISGATSSLICSKKPACKISGMVKVDTTEKALQAAVDKQPVIVNVEADKTPFQLYMGGIISGAGCGHQVNHQLLLVGYGTENSLDYW